MSWNPRKGHRPSGTPVWLLIAVAFLAAAGLLLGVVALVLTLF